MMVIEKIPKELLNATNKFAMELEWARRVPIYEIHKWWARRYSGIVRLFLIYNELDYRSIKGKRNYDNLVKDLYYNPPNVKNKTLLDPFCGGGSIILEASKLGYEVYGIEINKLAYLMLSTYNNLIFIDFEDFKSKIINIFNEISEYWKTKCLKDHNALIIHTFLAWKNHNGEIQIRFNEIKRLKDTSIYYCEKCKEIFESCHDLSSCIFCGEEFNKEYSHVEYKEIFPYAIEYYCKKCGERKIKSVSNSDIRNFNVDIPMNLFTIPKLNETKRLINHGFERFEQLLSKRQLLTFKTFIDYFKDTQYESIAKLMVSDSLRSCSYLAYYSGKYKKVIPGFVIKSYWLPVQPVELNPLSFRFDLKGELKPLGRGNIISSYNKIKRAVDLLKEDINYTNNTTILLGAAQNVLKKFNKKVDIVFTDPPYANYQFYSDLSLFSLAIIDRIDDGYVNHLLENEIVLRKKKQIVNYKNKLKEVFSLIKKSLNDDGRLIVTFHHSDFKLLMEILKIFKELSFNLQALYPVIGESSGKLSKRKLYLDLLFVFGKKSIGPTYYTTTDIFFTKEDQKLMESLEDIISMYNHNHVS